MSALMHDMQTIRRNFNSIFLTIHTGICILLLITPIALSIPINVADEKTFSIYDAVKSIEYRISLYISLVASVIMSLELIFRLFIDLSLIFSFKNILANILLVMWLIISDCVLLTYVTTYLDLKCFNIIHQARFILLSWSVCIYLNLYSESKFWGSRWAIFPVIATNSVRVVTSFIIYYNIPIVILVAFYYLGLLSTIILIVQSIRWFVFIYSTSKRQPITKNQYICGIYVVANLCCNIGVVLCIVTRRNPFWYNSTTNDLISQSYVYTAFYVVFAAFQGRVVEREVVISQNALEVKQMFIRYMSHEIRTPLNTVMMGLQHLQEDMIKSGDSLKRIETVEDAIESCEIAVKTLNNMLLYDKVETKLLALDKENIQVMPFIDKIIKLFRTQASHLKVNLSVTYVPDTCDGTAVNWEELTLYADVEKLAQVYRNIISNSLKFTPQNGKIDIEIKKVSINRTAAAATTATTPTIPTTTLTTLTDMIELRVTDTGAGISLENQCKLFQGIIQFRPGKLQAGGGSGLGLYIAKGIVDAHGGLIAVTSDGEGRGSTFTVTVPLSEPQGQGQGQSIIGNSHKSTMNCPDSNKKSLRNQLWRRICKPLIVPMNYQKIYASNRNEDVKVEPLPPPSLSLVDASPKEIHLNDDSITANHRNFTAEMFEGKVEQEKVDADVHMLRDGILRLDDLQHTFPAAVSENTSGKTLRTGIATRRPVVLVVDDVASNRKMMHRLLQDRCEYSMDAANGVEAVAVIRDAMSRGRHIDVITIDYQMPVMDGPTATRQIRELGYTGVILGVTGNALAEDISEFMACGADQVLIKPLNVLAFDAAVQEQLTSRVSSRKEGSLTQSR